MAHRHLILEVMLCLLTCDAQLLRHTKLKKNIIGGHGDWKFRFDPNRVLPPFSAIDNVQDGHGLVLDTASGDVYYTFNPQKVTNNTQVLVQFAPNGYVSKLLGEPGGLLAKGVPHGLRLEQDRFQSFLYHANNAQRVTKTKLDGQVIWSTDFSNWERERPHFWPIRPTDAIVIPNTGVLLVADGYGSSWIHALNKTTGDYLEGKSFGGFGNSTNPVKFDTPHSISLDFSSFQKDSGQPTRFIVSDRSNNRLVYVTADGDFVKAAPMAPLPCNVDTSFIDRKEGRVAVIPSLGQQDETFTNGSVVIWDAEFRHELSRIEIARLLGDQGHQHPHDAIFFPNGDLVVCCWSGPSNPGQGPARGTTSYWQRLLPSNPKMIAQQ
jgi:hypothetical protein